MAVVSLKNRGDEEIPGVLLETRRTTKSEFLFNNLIYLSPKFALSALDGQCRRFFSLP